jgi:hypothetical protein
MENFSDEKDILNKNAVIRTYQSDFTDLDWHKEPYCQVLESLNKNDWQIHFKNMLPCNFGEKTMIKKDEYYRILKGKTPLKMRIIKFLK